MNKQKMIFEELKNSTARTVKKHTCPKCKGIIVTSHATSLMAAAYSYYCACEYAEELKREKPRKNRTCKKCNRFYRDSVKPVFYRSLKKTKQICMCKTQPADAYDWIDDLAKVKVG